jgi:hypothetical protein
VLIRGSVGSPNSQVDLLYVGRDHTFHFRDICAEVTIPPLLIAIRFLSVPMNK